MWLVECYYYFKDPVASSPATQRHIPDNIHFQSPSREPKIPPMLAIHYEELWSFSIDPTYYTILCGLELRNSSKRERFPLQILQGNVEGKSEYGISNVRRS